MFGFISMFGNYEDRKVARYNGEDFFISTAEVTDSNQPYETAICHPRYNDSKIVIVQMYRNKMSAKTGHKKWVKKMCAKQLPISLKDVSTCCVIRIAKSWGVNLNEDYNLTPTVDKGVIKI